MKMILAPILFLIVGISLVGFFLYLVKNPLTTGKKEPDNQITSVCLKEKCFAVELATTPVQQARGLMGREKLDNNKGMLFVFQKEGIYPFWMKDTLIPLDMIWIDSNNKIVFISQNAQPCKSLICPQINPGVNAMYVLEINSGISEELDLQLGDKCDIIS